MKKLLVILCVLIFTVGCNSGQKNEWEFQKKNSEKNQGLTFQKIDEMKKNKFNFDKKNYSEGSNSNQSNNSAQHPGCTSACCSKK